MTREKIRSFQFSGESRSVSKSQQILRLHGVGVSRSTIHSEPNERREALRLAAQAIILLNVTAATVRVCPERSCWIA